MPAALPLAIGAGSAFVGAAGAAAGAAGAAGFLGLTVTGWTAIGVGLSIAGTLAQTLLAQTPDKPKMQDGDVSVKQAIPPRTRLYGRQRLGGVFLYYDSTPDGDLKTLICHAAHECDALEEHWLNDERVQVDDGVVTDDPWGKFEVVTIVHWPGAPDQSITDIDDDFWTTDHRGRGLCCTYVKYADLKDEDQIKVFPSGPPPYRTVLRGAKVFDPRAAGTGPADQDIDDEATWTWSDNAALVVLDYMTRLERGVPVGFGIALDRIDLDSFAAAADICDQEIPLKAGGTEKRWRAWGAYELTEDRKAVLQDLLDACGGRIIQGPDGRLGLTVGAPGPTAAVTLTEDHILEWDLNQGKPAIERINEVRATYVSQAWEWTETEAGIQLDQAAIDRNGVESSQVKLRFVPSESQAQRVAREVLRRGNPSHTGRIRTMLAGLDAWGERWIRLQIAELDIDALFEITSMSLNQADMTVSLEVTSYDAWWEWTAATDEQDPAIPPPNSDDDAEVPVPENVTVAIAHRLYNTQTPVAVGVVTWDPPPRSVYVAKARYRPVTDPAAPWQPLPVAQDDNQVETFPLEDGTAYEAQVRFIGPRGSGSDWSAPPATFTAVADPVAPASPISLTAQANVPATGQVTVSAKAPNDPRHLSLRFFRNGSNSFAGATLIDGPLYCAPLSTQTHVDTPPAAGDWYYFATSSNWSNVESAPLGGVLAEVSPAAPAITSPAGPISSYDKRPAVAGNGATAGASIKLYANAVQVGTATAAGDGSWTVTPSTDLGIGANAMTAKQTVGGNESVASGSVAITVVAIDADAWAIITAMTNRPDFVRQSLIKTLVDALKSAAVWTRIDRLFVLAAHDSQASLLEWKSHATGLTATTVTTAPTFTADRGWQGGGAGATAGGYLAGTFSATVGSNQFLQDSSHLAVWTNLASSGSVQGTYREAGGGQALIACRNPTAVLWCMSNAAAADIPAQTGAGTGFYAWSRQASAGYTAYQDANSMPVTRASAALASGAFHVLRGGSGFSNARVSAACWGGGLSGAEVAALRTALNGYMVGVGAA